MDFVINGIILAALVIGWQAYKWKRRQPVLADDDWSACVACGSAELTWDRGDIEGPIDDLYTCDACGHTGGPGLEFRTKQAELTAFAAQEPDAQWHAILQHWRNGHEQLSRAKEFMVMESQGHDHTRISAWPMMHMAGCHHLGRALAMLARLGDDDGRISAVTEQLGRNSHRPDVALEESKRMQDVLSDRLAHDLTHRGVALANYREHLGWLHAFARGALLQKHRKGLAIEDVTKLGDDLPQTAVVAVVEGLMKTHRASAGLEDALLVLITGRGEDASEAVATALVEVGTRAAVEALEAPPDTCTRAQRKRYKAAAADLRARLSRLDGRLSLPETAGGAGALSDASPDGEVSLIDDQEAAPA